MTSNPAFTERNIQKTQRLSPRFLSGAKIFGHVSHSTELVRMCLACQHFDFNSADCGHQLIFANNGKGIHLSVQETSVGQERVTNPKERLRGTIEGLGTRFVKVSARQHARTARTRSTSTSVNNINGSVSTSCPATARYSCSYLMLNSQTKRLFIRKNWNRHDWRIRPYSVVTDFTLLISGLLASIGHLVYSWRAEN